MEEEKFNYYVTYNGSVLSYFDSLKSAKKYVKESTYLKNLEIEKQRVDSNKVSLKDINLLN